MKNAHLECGTEVDDKVFKFALLYFCILLITLMATVANLEATSFVRGPRQHSG
jgi:hypothetical protein